MNMNRRKPESAMPNKRESWSKLGGGLFSKRSVHGNKADEASTADPTSATSSVIDMGLPSWEKPVDAVRTEKYAKVPVPEIKKTSPMGYSMPTIPQKTQHKERKPLGNSQHQDDIDEDECRDELTDMVITCNNSFGSISDDVTWVSSDELSPLPRSPKKAPKKKPASKSKDVLSPCSTSSREKVKKPLTSLSASNPKDRVPSCPSSLTRSRILGSSSKSAALFDEPVSTKQAFIWKKGPNGRYMKVPVDGDVDEMQQQSGSVHSQTRSQQQKAPPPKQPEIHPNDPSVEALRTMEDKLLNEALELSKQQKQELLHNSTLSSTSGLMNAPSRQLNAQEMEEEMLNQALELSRHDEVNASSSPCRPNLNRITSVRSIIARRPANVQAELDGQEEALVRLAIEKSRREAEAAQGSGRVEYRDEGVDRTSLFLSARTKYQQEQEQNRVLYLGGKPPPNVRAGFLHQPVKPKTSSSSSTSSSLDSKNFVWKKGPNNRYIKVPIAMDQLDEDRAVEDFSEHEEPSSRGGDPAKSGGLTRMEEAMLQEAMKRSMRDLYAGL
uniref:Uncharacterized protein n=1 Tax=Amphora coffeiformis TaxID=265554 RepID=A0A7S3P7W8_9STRA|mmetsp:Transcript_9685/g.18520  ORF Transcript_9685/g.18520 Transcript_9685/m.18520 type:complete len:554 (+) Transcript_9685:106-1767(+)|eukprot:scaffold1803_cov92-Amphora_coffeaeformis.AAC.65